VGVTGAVKVGGWAEEPAIAFGRPRTFRSRVNYIHDADYYVCRWSNDNTKPTSCSRAVNVSAGPGSSSDGVSEDSSDSDCTEGCGCASSAGERKRIGLK